MAIETGLFDDDNRSPEAMIDRLIAASLGTFDLFAITLGDRLGYYEALKGQGPLTALELAERTATHPRYTREWLEQQAVTEILGVVDASQNADERAYFLPEPYHEVFTKSGSLLAGIPIARSVVGSVAPFEQVVSVYRIWCRDSIFRLWSRYARGPGSDQPADV